MTPEQMLEISKIPEADLKRELQRREEVKVALARAEHEKRAALVLSQILPLLALVPEHDRTSCSDKDPSNEDRGCTRCQLLKARDYGFIPEGRTLVIRFERK